MSERVCGVCGITRLTKANKTGICTGYARCRKALRDRVYGTHRPPVQPAYVYAILYPSAGILKVGKSTMLEDYALSSASRTLAKKGIHTADGHIFWRMSGDLREEAFIHAHLAYRYPFALDNRGTKISEWFAVDGESEAELVESLNEIILLLPNVAFPEAA